MNSANNQDQPHRSANRVDSFRHAFAGWGYMLRTQRNSWIHSFFTIAVIVVGLWLRLNAVEWATLIIVIGLVWTAEFINTAIEAIVDLASPDLHPLAKVGKDVGAAAVLLSAGTAVIVGLLVLGPPLFEKVWTWIMRMGL
ncbi:MAG: diacylglycerol kinase family protein [Anaerolineae bacterium]|nr:diacylglycerol kinase family protein [Anaerolineae bacterium]